MHIPGAYPTQCKQESDGELTQWELYYIDYLYVNLYQMPILYVEIDI